MSLIDKYRTFKSQGVKLLPFQAHAGMAFFFVTIANPYWWFVAPTMLVIITGKEYMDMRLSGEDYSYYDLGSWVIGAVLAIINILVSG